MTILVDISQIVISNIAVLYLKEKSTEEIDESLIRHMVLNSLRIYNLKFKREYGEMIICCDSKNNWRKEEFPLYKAARKKQKEKMQIDWSFVYRSLENILSDLKDYFPYKVIRVDGCEADDIIGCLSRELTEDESILIISSDKDFAQLLKSNVKQFDPKKKEFIDISDPLMFLKQLIIKGDSSDGVPNILSDDDTFLVEGKRQKSIFSSKLEEWLRKDPVDFCENKQILQNYERNKKLIDLSFTPPYYEYAIMKEYEKIPKGNVQSILKYLMNNRMRNLIECIGDFKVFFQP